MESDRSSWAEVIRVRREALEMTQHQLAQASGLSLKTISNLENEALTPQRGTLRKIRDALGLSSDLSVATSQAREGIGLERVLGAGLASPVQRTGLDGYLSELENRLMNLEDRVAHLEASDPATTTTSVDMPRAAYPDTMTDAEREALEQEGQG